MHHSSVISFTKIKMQVQIKYFVTFPVEVYKSASVVYAEQFVGDAASKVFCAA